MTYQGGLSKVLRALLDESGTPYKQNGKSFILECPRCRKSEKLYIRKSDGRFVCWVCKDSEGFEGAPEWCFTDLLGIPVSELKKRIYGDQGEPGLLWLDVRLVDFFDEDDLIPNYIKEELPFVEPDPGFREISAESGIASFNYLQSRGISMDTIQKYGILHWPKKSSVVFPVKMRNQWLGWQTRIIGPSEWIDPETGYTVKVPKAETSWGLKKDRTFMFIDNIQQGSDHVVLCEGPIDALKADLCGGNVATLGKAVSNWQLNAIKNSGAKKLYLALDPDAFRESQRILREVAGQMLVYDMRPPQGREDLGEMEPKEVLELMHGAPLLPPTHLFLYLENHYA